MRDGGVVGDVGVYTDVTTDSMVTYMCVAC